MGGGSGRGKGRKAGEGGGDPEGKLSGESSLKRMPGYEVPARSGKKAKTKENKMCVWRGNMVTPNTYETLTRFPGSALAHLAFKAI